MITIISHLCPYEIMSSGLVFEKKNNYERTLNILMIVPSVILCFKIFDPEFRYFFTF